MRTLRERWLEYRACVHPDKAKTSSELERAFYAGASQMLISLDYTHDGDELLREAEKFAARAALAARRVAKAKRSVA